MTATVTVSAGAPEPLCRTELPKASLTSKTATSPHGCPDPSTSETNVRAARARSARPASVTLSRTATLAITVPTLPRPPHPGETSRAAGGRRDMHAQLGPERQAGTTGLPSSLPVTRPWSWHPVRGRPCEADGPAHRSLAPIPVRYASVDPATCRSAARQGDTRRDREERPASARIRS
jgi:hypothetical protein